MNTKEKIQQFQSLSIPFVNIREHSWQKHFLKGYRKRLHGFVCLVLVVFSGQSEQAVEAQRKAPPGKPGAIELNSPNGLTLDGEGNLFISDISAHRIFKLDRRGKLAVIAGTGQGGFSGDGGPAINAQLHAPHDLAFDAAGNLLIADTGNQRIRRINRQGVIATLIGGLNNPQSIALDQAGDLLIADTYNHLIRRVDRDGKMTTIAGTVPGFGGDGGPAGKAQINLPMAVAVGPDRSIYISDAANSRIRRISPDGIIHTVVGFGPAQDTYGGGFAGDGGPAEKAKLFSATDRVTAARVFSKRSALI